MSRLQSVKDMIPAPVRRTVHLVKRLFVHREYDSSAYWRQRASAAGQAKVLWGNEAYNRCYRELQQKILRDFLNNLPKDARILDIGCGSGVVARMIDNGRRRIDAVDFEEMIEVARKENPSPHINYICSPAESFFDNNKTYDAVISSACFSAIRDTDKLQQAIHNCAMMLAPHGRLLMIDPFHRWKFLARARFASRDVVRYMEKLDFQLITKSGVLFWPFREWLANSTLPEPELRPRFARGERLLSLFGQHFWADYKILHFKRRN